MSLSLITGQTLPQETTTEAYVGNSVANVFASFDPESLTDEGLARVGKRADSSKFLLQDEVGDSLIKSFTADYRAGGGTKNSEAINIEIINPSTELEIKLLAFYDALFPTKKDGTGSFEDLAAALNEHKSMIGEDDDGMITWRDLAPSVPTIFVRYGYGETMDGGSSRIIKTLLTNVSYKLNTNQDKVMVLMLTDTFTYFSTSQTFNNRVKQIKIPIVDNEGRLRRPSDLVKNVLGDWTAVYPMSMPYTTLQGKDNYADFIDGIVFRVAQKLASKEEPDFPAIPIAYDEENFDFEGPINAAEGNNSWITEEEEALMNSLLNRPILDTIDRDYEALGTVTIPIMLHAYELFFKEVGCGFSHSITKLPETTPNTLSEEQVGNNTDHVKQDIDSNYAGGKDSVLTDSPAENTRKASWKTWGDNTVIVLPDDLSLSHAHLIKAPGTSMAEKTGWLSYWPKALEKRNRSPDQGTVYANIVPPGVKPQKIGWTMSSIGGGTQTFSKDCFKVFFDGPPAEIGVKAPAVSAAGENAYIQGGDPTEANLFFLEPDPGAPNVGRRIKFVDVPTQPLLEDWEGYVFVDGLDGETRLRNENGESLGGLSTSGLLLLEVPESVDHFNAVPGVRYLTMVTADGVTSEPWTAEVADFDSGLLADPNLIKGKVAPSEGVGRILRDMTVSEKKLAERDGVLPIWLKPGLWNVNRKPELETIDSRPIPQPEGGGTYTSPFSTNPWNAWGTRTVDEYKFTSEFPITELNALIDAAELNTAKEAWDATYPSTSPGGNLSPWDVQMMTMRDYSGPLTLSHRGGEILASRGNFGLLEFGRFDSQLHQEQTVVPLYDAETNDLVPLYDTDSSGLVLNPVIEQSAPELMDWINTVGNDYKFGQFCSTLRLEPTIDTARFLQRLTADANNTAEEAKGEETPLDQPLAESPEVVVSSPRRDAGQGFVTFGTQGGAPSITESLRNFLASLNNFVIGNQSKLDLKVLDLERLSPAELDFVVNKLFRDAGAGEDLIKDIKEAKIPLILIGPEDNLKDIAFDDLLRPILSFPEIVDYDEQDPFKTNRAVFLNYGSDKSIVTDLQFKGDVRWLTEFQSTYVGIAGMARLEVLGDAAKTARNQVFAKVESYISENQSKWDEIVRHDSGRTPEEIQQARSEAVEANAIMRQIERDYGDLAAEFIPLDVAQYFAKMKIDEDDDTKEIQAFYSTTINNGRLMDFYKKKGEIFLEEDVQYTITVIEEEVTKGSDTGPDDAKLSPVKTERKQIAHKIAQQARFVNFYALYNFLDDFTRQAKVVDTQESYLQAMRDQTWEVELTTLGIPEISYVQSDMGKNGRVIILTVFDVRSSDDRTPHWISGAYTILGFNHTINPNDGYTSSMQLLKVGVHPHFIKEGHYE